MNENKNFLGTEPIGKLLLRLALPTVAAQMINMLYNIVDRIYIGHIPNVGALALTGVGVCMPLIMIVAAFAALVGNGGAPRASIFMGQRDTESAEKTLGNCFLTQLIISAILTIVLLIGNRTFLLSFGASENTIEYAVSYMNIYAIGTLFVQLTLGMNAFITAQGFAKTGMLSVLIGAVTNIILDPILIFGLAFFPKMGISGAAIATGVGQLISLMVYLAFYFKGPVPVKLEARYKIPGGNTMKKLYGIGIPAILNLALPSVMIFVLNGLLAQYSRSYVVILGIYYKLQTFLYFPASGIIQGMRPVIGYNFGAGERERVGTIYKTTLAMTGVIMAAGTLLCLTIANTLIGAFTDNAETIIAGGTALRIISAGFIVSTVSVTASGALEGIGMGVQSLVISLLRYIVVILPSAFILCHLFGGGAVWNAFWITEFAAAVVAEIVYRGTIKRTMPKPR